MSSLRDVGYSSLGKVWPQYEANLPSIRKMSKILMLIVAITASVAIVFSFTEASQYLSIIPGSSHAYDSSHLPDSSHVSESSKFPGTASQVLTSTPVTESPHVPEESIAPETLSRPVTPPPKQWDVEGWPVPEVPLPPIRNNRRFVIIVPATAGSPDLCKTVLSAMALGYPVPIIVGWGMDYHVVSKWKGGPNLIKIPAVMNYLDSVLRDDAHPSEKLEHDDIVLIVDGYDIWFQLPPEVLLRRYHDINEKANARLREQWKGQGPMPMQQTIVAASEKNCNPRPEKGSDIHCPALPDSPIREDLYGPETDKNQSVKHDLRPRYINGGVYIGQAGDMRRWFRRATSIMTGEITKGAKLKSEQGITGQVFGEQEVWRQWQRDHDTSIGEAMALVQRDFEYHIGLDYFQVISVQTHDARDDGRFLLLNNKANIEMYSAEQNISPVRLQGVPDDVKAAHNPLADLVEQADWGEMPLYADFFTESVPIIVHHNGKDNKGRRQEWWNLPWFFKYLRQLVQRRMMPTEQTVLATVETENGTFSYRLLDAEKLGKKPRIIKDSAIERLTEIQFDAICGAPNEPWWDEVFRDGQGNLH